MKSYFPSIRQYSWILLACIVVASAAGFLIAKAQLSLYQASSVVLVDMSAPGTTYAGGPAGGTATDSLARALNYSAELQTTSIMQYIIDFDPQLQQRGYTASDLITDVVPSTSTTAATITLLATARHAVDAVLLANDVAKGFAAYTTAQVQSQLAATTAALKAQISTEQQVEAGWEAKIAALPSTSTGQYAVYSNELADATRTLDASRAQLALLPPAVKGDAFVIQLAGPKDATPSTRGYVILGVTAGIGLLIGFLIMLLVIFLDNRLRSDAQVKEKLGMAYLGGLCNTKQLDGGPMSVGGDVLHEVADIGVNLRLTGVLPGAWQAPRGVILLVTSPLAAEGKTTLAATLSVALARGGNSVLVIDGNLRRPSTHLAFKMNGAGAGLSGLLKGTGRESAHDAVVRTSVPGVWLLPAGPAVEDAALLLGQRMPGVLAQLRTAADIVIIDGPALLSGADASELATMSDGIALVIDARHEKLPLLLRAKELLSSLTHTPIGVIMNRLTAKRGGHYYASAYLGGAPAEKWIPTQAYVSAGNEVGSGSQGAPVFDVTPALPLLPIQASPRPLPPPSGTPTMPGPAGIFSPNRAGPLSLPGVVPQSHSNGFAMLQQDAPAPSPRPAPQPGASTPPLRQRPGTGQ